jgi:hypothetical protein
MATARAFVPRPRRGGLVTQELDGELLIYVEETHQACSLNASAARIWALCDGCRDAANIAAEVNLQPDVVATAVRQLADAGLLENAAELPASLSRRRVMLGVGLAVPVILMIMAPGAAGAASLCQAAGHCNPLGPPCCSTGEACPVSNPIC